MNFRRRLKAFRLARGKGPAAVCDASPCTHGQKKRTTDRRLLCGHHTPGHHNPAERLCRRASAFQPGSISGVSLGSSCSYFRLPLTETRIRPAHPKARTPFSMPFPLHQGKALAFQSALRKKRPKGKKNQLSQKSVGTARNEAVRKFPRSNKRTGTRLAASPHGKEVRGPDLVFPKHLTIGRPHRLNHADEPKKGPVPTGNNKTPTASSANCKIASAPLMIVR